MAKDDWTDQQNDATVADYFAMLATDTAGRAYNKSAHRRALALAIGRSEGAIEFKHQNISAVLKGLGEEWIPGYLPAFNFQWLLVDAVARWLNRNRSWIERSRIGGLAHAERVRETGSIWFEPPPTMRNTDPPAELDLMRRVAHHFDVAGRDERNRVLGRAGEEVVLHHERGLLIAAGRDDLAERVRWTAQEDGDGAGFDILSFDTDESERLIEVKTTNGWERTPFHISRNELTVAEDRRENWHLVRLYNFSRSPRAFALRPPLDAHVALTATSFLASFEQAS